MEKTWNYWMVFMIMVIFYHILITESLQVGVNYGLVGNNLPAPEDVIKFIKSKPIGSIRIFEPNLSVLEALRGSGISVAVGVRNEDLTNLASSQEATTEWLNRYIIPYVKDVGVQFISVGNEVIPGTFAGYVLPAIQNFYNSLKAAGLGRIPVTTVVATQVLATSYPPSAGTFGEPIMNDIVSFLYSKTAPLMINVYPYLALVSDPTHISLDYALFNSKTPAFTDGAIPYYSLFDATFDAFVAAIARVVGDNNGMEIIVGESGWPSAGGEYASVENARTYNNNFKNHASKGTPKYGIPFDAFVFALFNENLKPAGVEQNFGNFYPNMQPVYPLW